MCSACFWKETGERIAELVNDDDHRFAFAFDTLTGIRKRILEARHISPAQLRAIDNIEFAGKKRR